jgi:hypothetical protein
MISRDAKRARQETDLIAREILEEDPADGHLGREGGREGGRVETEGKAISYPKRYKRGREGAKEEGTYVPRL